MTGITRRLFNTALGTTLAAGGLSSGILGTWVTPAQAQQGGASVVTVATIGEPPTLDPVGTTSDLVSIITQHMFETLFTFDGEWKLAPLVASALPQVSADGKTYTIPLRSGVTFHDGSKVTADDVVASLDHWTKASPRGKTVAPLVESIAAKGADAVVIALKEPFAPLWRSTLPWGSGYILNRKQVELAGGRIRSDPKTSCGPYVMSSFTPGQKAVLTRNPDYKDFRPEFDEIQVFAM